MKKIWLIFFLLCIKMSVAQVREVGLKTGISNSLINISSIDNNGNSSAYKTDKGQSFYVQLYTQFYNYQNFSLQGGLGMIEKNSDYQYKIKVPGIVDSLNVNSSVETRSFFIEFDAKLKLLIPELPKVIPYLLVGPQISFINKKTNTIPFNIASPIVQGNLGFGADFDFKKIHVFAEYNRLLSLNSNYSEDANYEYQEKTGVFLIGLKFLIKPKNKEI